MGVSADKTKGANITYDPEKDLITITPLNGAEVDLEEYNDQFETAKKLTSGKPSIVLVDSTNQFNVTKEAREESLNPEKTKHMIAQAIIVGGFLSKLLATFYINFHKPTTPNKIFTDKDEAICWLEECRMAYLKNRNTTTILSN